MWHACKCLIAKHTFAFSSFLCSCVFLLLWKRHHHSLAVKNWLEINLIVIYLTVSSHAACGSLMIVSVHFLCLLIIYSPHCSLNDFFFKNKSDHEPSLFKTLFWLPFAYRLRTEIPTVAWLMGLCGSGLCLPCSWALAFFILHPSTFLEHLI